MCLAADPCHGICRQWFVLCLQVFLQTCLGVLECCHLGNRLQPFPEQAEDAVPDRGKVTVEVYGAENRFQGIGKNGVPGVPATPALTGTELQVVAELQSLRDFCQ